MLSLTRWWWLAAALVFLAATLVAVLGQPVVDTFDLQRRDRLAPSARFVTFAYQFLLSRPPDPQGLATYQRIFDDGGPAAVARAIAASDEYRRVNPEVDTVSDAVIAQTVSAYRSGSGARPTGSDVGGRVGFVLLIGAALQTLTWLWRKTRNDRITGDTRIYLPTRYVTSLFACLALMSWVSSNALLASFGSGRFGYIEWLSQVTRAAAARGAQNVWTPYPQGTADVLIGVQAVADESRAWSVPTCGRASACSASSTNSRSW